MRIYLLALNNLDSAICGCRIAYEIIKFPYWREPCEWCHPFLPWNRDSVWVLGKWCDWTKATGQPVKDGVNTAGPSSPEQPQAWQVGCGEGCSSVTVTFLGLKGQVTGMASPPAVPGRAGSGCCPQVLFSFEQQLWTELFSSSLVIKLN